MLEQTSRLNSVLNRFINTTIKFRSKLSVHTYVLKEKSRNMFHNFKSRGTFNSSTLNLTVLNQNILYLTHKVDKCVSMLRRLELDHKLQNQVDSYFDEDKENIPEEEKDFHK